MISLKEEITPKIFKKAIIVGGAILLVLTLLLGYFHWQANKKIPEPKTLKTSLVDGTSMEPTLKNGQEVQVDLLYYKFHEIERGDIVAINLNSKSYIKRVIALAEDEIKFEEGQLLINGQELKEDYLFDKNYKFTEKELKFLYLDGGRNVPQDSVLVLSDNRAFNFDSRKFSYLAITKIIGKVVSY